MSVAVLSPPPAPEPIPRPTARTDHGNRAGARRHASLNPATDTRAAAIELAAKERTAIELRVHHYTFDQIAEELGYKCAPLPGSASCVACSVGWSQPTSCDSLSWSAQTISAACCGP